MSWGNSWDLANGSKIEFVGKATDKISSFEMTDTVPLEGETLQPKTPWEQAKRDMGKALLDIIPRIYNKVPTHDPYANTGAQLYYSCGCGAILDPGVKRFAELNNCASNAGWKIRFSDSGYVPYCVDCGEGVE